MGVLAPASRRGAGGELDVPRGSTPATADGYRLRRARQNDRCIAVSVSCTCLGEGSLSLHCRLRWTR